MRPSIVRIGALAASAALALVALTGCGAGSAPQCSDSITGELEGSGTTITNEFPAPELLVGGGIYCYVAIESDGTVAGVAFFEGANGDELAIARLEAAGFETSESLGSSVYEKDDLIAYVTPSDGPLSAEDGVPAELVGKELAILSVVESPLG